MTRSYDPDIWKDRPKSLLVKELINYGNLSLNQSAEILGISVSYFNNKLTRNSFSMEDIQLLIYGAKLKLTIQNFEGNIWKDISLESWYPEDAAKVKAIKQKNKLEEYQELKHKLAEMKELYGFDD